MRATTLARIELRRSPCSPLPRFLVGASAGLLGPTFRATLLPSEDRRRSLPRLGCLWICLHPHPIWQATESYLEGGNAFGLVLHLGILTHRHLSPQDHGGGGGGRGGRGGGGLGLGGCAALNTDLRIAISTLRGILLLKARPLAASERVDMLHARR